MEKVLTSTRDTIHPCTISTATSHARVKIPPYMLASRMTVVDSAVCPAATPSRGVLWNAFPTPAHYWRNARLVGCWGGPKIEIVIEIQSSPVWTHLRCNCTRHQWQQIPQIASRQQRARSPTIHRVMRERVAVRKCWKFDCVADQDLINRCSS